MNQILDDVYKIKHNYGGFYIFPTFFKNSLFAEYYELSRCSDLCEFTHKVDKKRKKKAKKLKKEIISYMNDYKILSDENKEYFNESSIINFEFVNKSIENENGRYDLFIRTIKYKTVMGSYEINDKYFEDLCKYTSNPELYLDTIRYNL